MDCLVGGTDDHHTNTFAVDVTTLSLKKIPGIKCLETPFPGGGLAIGAAPQKSSKQAVERVFVSENRYDHVGWTDLVAKPGGGFEFKNGGSIGEEGQDYMLKPEKVAVDAAADEVSLS